MPKRLSVAFAALVSLLQLCLAGVHAVAALPAYRTVALGGERAPGTGNGVFFREFNQAALSSDGVMSFRGRLMGNTTENRSFGIWSEAGSDLHLVARAGQLVPDPPGRFTIDFGLPLHNSGGDTFFSGTVGTRFGVWAERSGVLESLAIIDDPAPGTGAGITFSSVSDPAINDAGQYVIDASIKGPGIVDHNRSGIWLGAGNDLQLVAREGDPAPGAEPGTTYRAVSQRRFSGVPALTSNGKVMINAHMTGPNAPSNGGEGIWVGEPGNLDLVMRSGMQAPSGPPGALIGDFTNRDVMVNDAGDVAVQAMVFGVGVNNTNNFGIFAKRGGMLEEVARNGSQAPGVLPGEVFNGVGQLVMNGASDVALEGQVRLIGGTTRSGLWAERNRVLELIALNGDLAPSAAPGEAFQYFDELVYNDAGQVAFSARTTANRAGVWAEDINGVLRKIVLQGDVIEYRPGQFGAVTDVPFDPIMGLHGSQDGRGNSFNARGQIGFRASVNGQQGLFVSNLVVVPEPTSYALSAMTLLALARVSGRLRPRAYLKVV